MLAVERLLARGVPEELIPIRLAHAFYVDMDELNSVLESMRESSKATEQPAQSGYRAVA
ncbi:hypothetical protein [Chelativorans sp. Marseille-P2723]|uniref:hypothetical protein n=1 Tax=Chelativorans sp. Marseille-P2723 TaxID=2709133 RepID=UPI001570D5D9|nr:hypothetical protein [Chelativorans sp. Marseille-P2723]